MMITDSRKSGNRKKKAIFEVMRYEIDNTNLISVLDVNNVEEMRSISKNKLLLIERENN